MSKNKASIQGYSNFIINKFHKEAKFEFEIVPYSICFTLKIYNDKSTLSHYYFVCPTGYLVSENSNPFYSGIMKYYKNIETSPINNFYFAYLQIDNDFLPINVQCFKISEDSPLLGELF